MLARQPDGGSGGPIGRMVKEHGEPFPTELDAIQIRVPKSSSVLGV